MAELEGTWPRGFTTAAPGFIRRCEEAREALLRACGDPREAQRRVLAECVGPTRDTHFGREHGFARIREVADLRRKLADADRRADAAEGEARRHREEAAAASEAAARAEALEREADELRTELLVARGEAEGARGEVEKRTAEIRKRLADLEAASAKNEERVVKAYQKIKADEKVRDRVRKALAIATQLLEEGLAAESPAEKERRPAALGGRE